MATYASATDLQNRLGAKAYLRLFDKDGDGTADAAVVSNVLQHADDLIDAVTRAAFGGVRFDASGTAPGYIVDIAVDLAIGRAANAYPGATATGQPSPYSALYDGAVKRLKMLAEDNEAQLPGQQTAPFFEGQTYVTAPSPVFGGTQATANDDGQVLVLGTGPGRTGF